jgi:pimeloyl-ACP methyl ester carboxylesterase
MENAQPPEDRAFAAQLDQTEQRYVLLRPEPWDPAAEHHLLVVLHGHGGDRWQYVREARGECQAPRDLAAKYGLLFVSPEYRGNSWLGPAAEADLVQLLADLRAEFRIGQVFLIGGSMGGTAALTFAALHPDLVAGVCAQNPLANFLGYDAFPEGTAAIAASFGGTAAEIPAEYQRRSAENWPEAFTMPVAITTGGQDTLVPPGSALRLARALQERGRPVLAIHREATGHETSYADTYTALDFVLRSALQLG